MKETNYWGIINEIYESFSLGENPFESCPFFEVEELNDLLNSPRHSFHDLFINRIVLLMKEPPENDSVGKFFMNCKMKVYPTETPLIRTNFNTAEKLANMRLDFGLVKYGTDLGPSLRIHRIDALQEVDMLNYCRIFLKEEDLEEVSDLLDKIVKIILK